jgi:hypothetical protein
MFTYKLFLGSANLFYNCTHSRGMVSIVFYLNSLLFEWDFIPDYLSHWHVGSWELLGVWSLELGVGSCFGNSEWAIRWSLNHNKTYCRKLCLDYGHIERKSCQTNETSLHYQLKMFYLFRTVVLLFSVLNITSAILISKLLLRKTCLAAEWGNPV